MTNAAATRAAQPPPNTAPRLQPRLTVSEPNDIYEQEADRIADQILRMPDPVAARSSVDPAPIRPLSIQRRCRACEEEELQRRAGAGPGAATEHDGLDTVAATVRQGGRPLDPATRAFFEPRFGVDFGGVRVHTDARAAESARSVQALAYTVGHNIVFDTGQYTPYRDSGKRLLAHELTHVVQQAGIGNTMFRDITAVTNSMVQRLGDLTRRPPALNARCPVPTGPPDPIEFVEFGNRDSTLAPLDVARLANFVMNWHSAGGAPAVRVDGFASQTGTDELNWELSCARAEVLVSELTSPTSGGPGIPGASIVRFAHGETSEFGAEEHNRRATITLSGGARPGPSPTSPGVIGAPRVAATRTRIGQVLNMFFSPFSAETLWVMREGDPYTGIVRTWQPVIDAVNQVKADVAAYCDYWDTNRHTDPSWSPGRTDPPVTDPNAYGLWVNSPPGTDPGTCRAAFETYVLSAMTTETFDLSTCSIGSFGIYVTVDSIDCAAHSAELNVWMYNAMDRGSFGRYANEPVFALSGMERQYMWWNWSEPHSWGAPPP